MARLSNHLRHLAIVIFLPTALACADEATPQWSNPDTDTAPDGRTHFHGPFFNEPLFTSFAGLPAHAFVRFECDLLILRSWDGSYPFDGEKRDHSGPDCLSVSLVGGPTLLSTTFSNRPDDPGFDAGSRFQNYPSPVPGDQLSPQTGATLKNTLGYNYPWPGAPRLFPMDATYHLVLLLPHRDPAASVRLEAVGLSGLIDESWGVTDAKLTPLTADEVPPPDDEAIAKAFATALDVQSIDQPAAVNTLVSGLDKTAAWIAANVQPQPIDAAAVDHALEDLAGDDTKITERTAAMTTLFDFGPVVEPFLRDFRASHPGEPRNRASGILDRLNNAPIADENMRRAVLATRVLEVIGTPTALDVRRQLVTAAATKLG